MKDAGVLFHVEIEVHFHAAFMGVTRHGVPQIAGRQFGQTHAQLAGLQYVRHEVFVMVRRLLVRLSPRVTGATSAGVTFLVG